MSVLKIKDANGNWQDIITIKGDKGEDGFSPIATVTKDGTSTVISITDKNGTTTETIVNGGGGDVDLSDYYTKEQIDEALANVGVDAVEVVEEYDLGNIYNVVTAEEELDDLGTISSVLVPDNMGIKVVTDCSDSDKSYINNYSEDSTGTVRDYYIVGTKGSKPEGQIQILNPNAPETIKPIKDRFHLSRYKLTIVTQIGYNGSQNAMTKYTGWYIDEKDYSYVPPTSSVPSPPRYNIHPKECEIDCKTWDYSDESWDLGFELSKLDTFFMYSDNNYDPETGRLISSSCDGDETCQYDYVRQYGRYYKCELVERKEFVIYDLAMDKLTDEQYKVQYTNLPVGHTDASYSWQQYTDYIISSENPDACFLAVKDDIIYTSLDDTTYGSVLLTNEYTWNQYQPSFTYLSESGNCLNGHNTTIAFVPINGKLKISPLQDKYRYDSEADANADVISADYRQRVYLAVPAEFENDIQIVKNHDNLSYLESCERIEHENKFEVTFTTFDNDGVATEHKMYFKDPLIYPSCVRMSTDQMYLRLPNEAEIIDTVSDVFRDYHDVDHNDKNSFKDWVKASQNGNIDTSVYYKKWEVDSAIEDVKKTNADYESSKETINITNLTKKSSSFTTIPKTVNVATQLVVDNATVLTNYEDDLDLTKYTTERVTPNTTGNITDCIIYTDSEEGIGEKITDLPTYTKIEFAPSDRYSLRNYKVYYTYYSDQYGTDRDGYVHEELTTGYFFYDNTAEYNWWSLSPWYLKGNYSPSGYQLTLLDEIPLSTAILPQGRNATDTGWVDKTYTLSTTGEVPIRLLFSPTGYFVSSNGYDAISWDDDRVTDYAISTYNFSKCKMVTYEETQIQYTTSQDAYTHESIEGGDVRLCVLSSDVPYLNIVEGTEPYETYVSQGAVAGQYKLCIKDACDETKEYYCYIPTPLVKGEYIRMSQNLLSCEVLGVHDTAKAIEEMYLDSVKNLEGHGSFESWFESKTDKSDCVTREELGGYATKEEVPSLTGYLRYEIVTEAPATQEEGVLYIVTQQ